MSVRLLDHGALVRPSLRMRTSSEAGEPIVLVVPREAAGARLDRFLAAALTALAEPPSRATVQRWIEDGRVTVNGEVRRVSDKVLDGARVEVRPAPPPTTEALPDADVRFEVLHMDDDVVVVDKPAGLVVHPARGHEGGTLVNGLLALGAFRVPVEEVADVLDPAGHQRPGIVHRLDKDTSGILVVARTAPARERLKGQFAAHTIDREYVALCQGAVTDRRIDTLHGRHPHDRLKFTTRVREGKRAVTHVRLLEGLARGRASHVVCRLETGRTHQIRVHLAEAGFPIVGDPLYGRPSDAAAVRAVAETLGRQALHARVLGFVHPTTGARMTFTREPPADFAAALAALRALGGG